MDDSPERRRMRLYLLRLHDPHLQAFVEEAKKRDTPEALIQLIYNTNLAGVDDSDLAELFFVLGPNALSALIQKMLLECKTDSDLQDIAALTEIRHSLFASLSSPS